MLQESWYGLELQIVLEQFMFEEFMFEDITAQELNFFIGQEWVD